jgi:hypothetical protein
MADEFEDTKVRIIENALRYYEREGGDPPEGSMVTDGYILEWVAARGIDAEGLEHYLFSVMTAGSLLMLRTEDPMAVLRAVAGGSFQVGFEMAAARYAKERPGG